MNNATLFKLAHKMTKQVVQTGDNYKVTFGLCLKAIKQALPHAPLSYNVLDVALLVIKITNTETETKMQAIKNHYSAVAAMKGKGKKGDSVFNIYNNELNKIENKTYETKVIETKKVTFMSKVKSFFKAA